MEVNQRQEMSENTGNRKPWASMDFKSSKNAVDAVNESFAENYNCVWLRRIKTDAFEYRKQERPYSNKKAKFLSEPMKTFSGDNRNMIYDKCV